MEPLHESALSLHASIKPESGGHIVRASELTDGTNEPTTRSDY